MAPFHNKTLKAKIWKVQPARLPGAWQLAAFITPLCLTQGQHAFQSPTLVPDQYLVSGLQVGLASSEHSVASWLPTLPGV